MALGGGERWGRGQEVEGAEWVTVGQLSPTSACSTIQSQAAATADIGFESTSGLHLRPGRAAGL